MQIFSKLVKLFLWCSSGFSTMLEWFLIILQMYMEMIPVKTFNANALLRAALLHRVHERKMRVSSDATKKPAMGYAAPPSAFLKAPASAFLLKGVLRDLRGIGMQSNAPLKSLLKKTKAWRMDGGKRRMGSTWEENLTASKSLMALVVNKKIGIFFLNTPRELSAEIPVPNTQPRSPGQPWRRMAWEVPLDGVERPGMGPTGSVAARSFHRGPVTGRTAAKLWKKGSQAEPEPWVQLWPVLSLPKCDGASRVFPGKGRDPNVRFSHGRKPEVKRHRKRASFKGVIQRPRFQRRRTQGTL